LSKYDEQQRERILILDLVDDAAAIAAYREWHRPGGPPEAVTRAIRDAGIERLDIYNAGNRLVMVMEVSPAYDPAAHRAGDAVNPSVQDWEARMDVFQQRLPFAPAGMKWVPTERIYSLDEQP